MGDIRGLSRANGVSVGGSAGRVVAWKGCRRYPWTDGRRYVPVVQTGFGHWAPNASKVKSCGLDVQDPDRVAGDTA